MQKGYVGASLIAAIAGVLIINVIYLLNSIFMPNLQSGWDAAASVFLSARFDGTIIWVIVGLLSQLAVAVLNVLVLAALLHFTGFEYYLLKGAVLGLIWWFIIMPIQIITGANLYGYGHPPTAILALGSIIVFNMLAAWMLHLLVYKTVKDV